MRSLTGMLLAALVLFSGGGIFAWNVWLPHYREAPRQRDATIPLKELAEADPLLRPRLADWREKFERNTDSADAIGELAIMLEAHGYMRHALSGYARAAKQEGSDVRWTYLMGVLAGRLGDVEEAKQALRQVVTARPDFAPAHERLGLLLMQDNLLVEAEERFRSMVTLAPDQPQGYVRLAAVELARHNYPSAIDLLELAIQKQPSYHEAHFLLGRAYRATGRPDQARIELARGSNANRVHLPDPWRAAVSRARVAPQAQLPQAARLIGGGRPEDALSLLEPLHQEDPENVNVLNYLALAKLHTGRSQEAEAHLRRALQIDPEDAVAHINLSAALMAQGNVSDALFHADRATQLPPALAQSHFNKGRILEHAGRAQDAVLAYRRAVELDATRLDYWIALGRLLRRLHRWPEAADALRAATDLKPDSAQAWYLLGLVCRELNRIQEAAHAFEMASTAQPRNARFAEALREMRAHAAAERPPD